MNNDLIGEQIAKFRKAAGLTQEELGRAVGVSTQAVSRWECGGAPDISLLPSVADKLGVSIDALFGREGGVVENIHDTVGRWLLSLPSEKRLDQLCRLIWGISMVSAIQQISTYPFMDIGYLDSCITTTGGNDILVRLAVDTSAGLSFGVGAEDLAFMSIWPRPKAGYAAWFPDRNLSRRLFALLARPGCLELLERLHDDPKARYYVPEVLAKQLGQTPAQVAELLTAMAELDLVKKLDLELETGPVNAYIVHENWAFIPFLMFTRCFLEKHDAFYIAWDDHDIPEVDRDPSSAVYGRLTLKNPTNASCNSNVPSSRGEKK